MQLTDRWNLYRMLWKEQRPTKAIGFDALPDEIKLSKVFTGNDLGRLGNIEQLPTAAEIEAFKGHHLGQDYLLLAKQLLLERKEAWLALLASI